ncbi:MAG: bacteriohemerythrin [Thermoguttaceae bacterium]|nr:bacteriohemerythrin [Thermoguttaceae bacterium]MDW8038218.1 bacteriohemerythrin [Thermoguttaceae bacterium]
MPISWDDSLLTGIPTVDAQHKELFRQVNAFHAAMLQGKAREELGKLLDFLGRYTQQHFFDEERFMEQYRCVAAATNKAAHQTLLKRFVELRQRFDQEKTNVQVVMDIYRELSDWLVNHVKAVDLLLRDAVQASHKTTVGAANG